MGRGEDRISYLPDPILQTILTMMPLKSAIRTDALSKRWRYLWQYSLSQTSSLEFDEDLAINLSAAEFVDTVNYYLSLNNCQNLERFHVFFSPFNLFAPDIKSWIRFATSKNVRYLDIDLSQGFKNPENGDFTDERGSIEVPSSLFNWDSLVYLSLSRCDFIYPLTPFKYSSLQSLSFSNSDIDDETFYSILRGCPLLESLTLRRCDWIGAIIITPDLKLKVLTIGDCGLINQLLIDTPHLKSFHYYGELCWSSTFLNISSLEDVLLSMNGTSRFLRDNENFLLAFTDVQILTVCSRFIVHLNLMERQVGDEFPMTFSRLKELQLLVASMTSEYLTCIFSFFYLCTFPFLEKLFIRLPSYIEDPNEERFPRLTINLNPLIPVSIDNLKVIKVTNFKGCINDIRLVSFFLRKANGLETMVLVLPRVEKDGGQERFFLRVLRAQVSLLPKASPCAEIVMHEFGEDDGLNPTHVNIYNENDWLPAIPLVFA